MKKEVNLTPFQVPREQGELAKKRWEAEMETNAILLEGIKKHLDVYQVTLNKYMLAREAEDSVAMNRLRWDMVNDYVRVSGKEFSQRERDLIFYNLGIVIAYHIDAFGGKGE